MKKLAVAIITTAVTTLGTVFAAGAPASVIVLDEKLDKAFGYAEVKGRSAEFKLANVPAGTKVKVVETDEDGETRTLEGVVGKDGALSLTVNGSEYKLELYLQNKGVTLNLQVVKGEGVVQLPVTLNERAQAARAAAQAKREQAPGGGQENAGTGGFGNAPATPPAGPPSGTPVAGPPSEVPPVTPPAGGRPGEVPPVTPPGGGRK